MPGSWLADWGSNLDWLTREHCLAELDSLPPRGISVGVAAGVLDGVILSNVGEWCVPSVREETAGISQGTSKPRGGDPVGVLNICASIMSCRKLSSLRSDSAL